MRHTECPGRDTSDCTIKQQYISYSLLNVSAVDKNNSHSINISGTATEVMKPDLSQKHKIYLPIMLG